MGGKQSGAAYRFLLALGAGGLLAGCAGVPPPSPAIYGQAPANGETGCYAPQPNLNAAYNQPYNINGRTYYPMQSAAGYNVRGMASWYGWESGSTTSMGTPFRPRAFTAASRTLPLPTCARVTNLSNGRSVVVLVNDRGPFVDGRTMDLSYGAAQALGIVQDGTAPVQIVALASTAVPLTPPVATAPAAPPAPPVTAAPALPPAPAPAPVPIQPMAPELPGPSQVYLQTGAFAVYNNAIREKNRLLAAGIRDVLIIPGYVRGQELYKVQIGPLPNGIAPEPLIEQLKAMGFSGFYSVQQ